MPQEQKEKKYECFDCHGKFLTSEAKSETMPDNFRPAHLPDNAVLPKCPHCDAVAFFGFTEVKL